MTEEANQNTTPTEPPMANTMEARTETGEILDQSKTLSTEQPEAVKEPVQESVAAPEKYEFTATDGVTLDATIVEAATPLLKELNLNQDQAQKLVDFYNKTVGDQAKLAQDAVVEMRTAWRNELAADKEIGSKLPAVTEAIGKMKAMLPADVRDAFSAAMDLTGAGDHPAVVKAIYKLSEFVVEGRPVSGSGPSKHGQADPGKPARPSAAQAMYPNLPSSS